MKLTHGEKEMEGGWKRAGGREIETRNSLVKFHIKFYKFVVLTAFLDVM